MNIRQINQIIRTLRWAANSGPFPKALHDDIVVSLLSLLAAKAAMKKARGLQLPKGQS